MILQVYLSFCKYIFDQQGYTVFNKLIFYPTSLSIITLHTYHLLVHKCIYHSTSKSIDQQGYTEFNAYFLLHTLIIIDATNSYYT